MAQYIIAYLGTPKSSSLEENNEHMTKYRAWLASLGDAVISPANPFRNTTTINPNGTVVSGSSSTMSGFTIIEADSEQAALSIAESCPYLEIGGTLEVSELMQMSG